MNCTQIDRLIREHTAQGIRHGTLATIEFIWGFELFNTRPGHNYETWSGGYRVSGEGVTVEREHLDDALAVWAGSVRKAKAGAPSPEGSAK